MGVNISEGRELFTQSEPGVFVVTYQVSADLVPERNQALVETLRRSARERSSKVAVVFDVSKDIGWVDVSVPTFWLKVTWGNDCPLCAMAIVTRAAAVRAAARGFAMANQVRRASVEVQVFDDVPSSLTWARERLSTPGP